VDVLAELWGSDAPSGAELGITVEPAVVRRRHDETEVVCSRAGKLWRESSRRSKEVREYRGHY
jgi:hypothetical protein